MAQITMDSLTRTLLISMAIVLGCIVQKVRVGMPISSQQPNYTCPVRDLQIAKCAHLNLTSIPQDLPHGLLVLSIRQNQLTELINMSFMNYNQLEELYAGHNFIAFIDSGTFETLPQLQVVRLDYNLITFLPIYFLQKNALLYIISLSHNKIRFALRGLEKLQVLSLGENRISNINNESFCGLHSLLDLKLYDNELNSISRALFACASNLQKIDLSRNKLAALDPQWFDGSRYLRNLILYKCGISRITVGPWNATNLQTLVLNKNNLGFLHHYTFTGLAKLKTLDVSGNANSLKLSEDALTSVGSLELLIMTDLGKFTMKASNTFMPSSLIRFNIAYNPLTCDCQLAWFRQWLNEAEGNIDLAPKNQIRCSSSSLKVLVNQIIWSFHPNEYCGINTMIIVSACFAPILVLTLGILVYLNRWWINYKLYLLKLAIVGYHEITEDRTPNDYEFQLNLMFHDGDEWWVDDCMKPFLEQRMPHLERVIFGDADLHPGSFYLNAIYDVIENSHKTILLLSNQSVDDTWYMTKLRMAVEHMNDTKLEKVILIFLEDIDDDHLPYLVRLLLSRNKPYLLWTEDEEGQEVFWAKVQKSMRSNRQMNNVIPV
eukprot:XP_011673405.1 PREDICTED: leucine-rich repeat and immunoglobulin-like domain-containing nogo receptor-interacting protein 3 [Strongylocentrotus purpuratus]